MEQTVKQENEEQARKAEWDDMRNSLLVLALFLGMGSCIMGHSLGELEGYRKGKEAAQIKTIFVGNLSGNNINSNDVGYIQNDGAYGVFKFSSKTNYHRNPGVMGATIEHLTPMWERTSMESNLVKNALEEVTKTTYRTYINPWAEVEYYKTNKVEETKINHYTGKKQ